MSTTIQTRKIALEMPENAYNVLNEMAIAYGQTIDKAALEMIYVIMEMDLTGGSVELDGRLAQFLCKKYGYNPRAWRKEAEA